MKRCPKCKGLNFLTLGKQDYHKCKDCYHTWGKDGERRLLLASIGSDVNRAFRKLFDDEDEEDRRYY